MRREGTEPTVVVRKARREDLKAVQDLNYQLFIHDQEYDPLLKMSWPYDKEGREYLATRVNGEEGVCFVAERDGKVNRLPLRSCDMAPVFLSLLLERE